MPVALTKLPQCLGGVGVDHAAAGHDHRLFAGPDHFGGTLQRRLIGPVAHDVPDALAEERDRVVVGLGLHVLRQRQRHRAGLGRAGQHTQRLGQGRQQLVGPVDAVPVLADRLEAVVDRHVLALRPLKLLQHRCHVAAGEDVARQEQHRQAVDRGRGRAGDHVGGARPDGADAGKGLQAVFDLGVGGRGVDRALFVAYLVVAEVGVLQQRFAHAGHAAMAKDPRQPAKNCVSTPSRSTYWFFRKRMRACAMVRRIVDGSDIVFSIIVGATLAVARCAAIHFLHHRRGDPCGRPVAASILPSP